ncbi:hypothetical protein PybrP1_001576 [[Pythium] brassicae (nom. inval.)]|nr:hypothetical protein PybrP1_001576 [[Pythium] brassicae (nom. inval.)]
MDDALSPPPPLYTSTPTPTPPPRSNMRAWSWVRVDGRNVVAVPARHHIRLYDSDNFILLATLAPSGHGEAPIAKVRWSAFHAKLGSLSAARLVVHAPARRDSAADRVGASDDTSQQLRVQFAAAWQLPLVSSTTGAIHSFSFSRCAERLLFSDDAGIGIVDIHNYDASANAADPSGDATPRAQVIWRSSRLAGSAAGREIVKFSPSEYVFASLTAGESRLQVWRVADSAAPPRSAADTATATLSKTTVYAKEVVCVDELAHPDPIVYYSWKPASAQLVPGAQVLDGYHKAQWFEPPRVLLTCSVCRVIRLWVESDDADASVADRHGDGIPVFKVVLVYQPHEPIDNFRWVLSKNRNISEEKFGGTDEQSRGPIDWISGVDKHGVMHLWRLLGVHAATPRVEETGVRIQVNAAESEQLQPRYQQQQQQHGRPGAALSDVEPLSEVCVMAYFSQDHFETPSALDIILQRADNIILSYNVAVARGSRRPRVKRKSWYRSHSGSIAALAAHPSLPLIVSVGSEPRATADGGVRTASELLIFWISFSAFSAESRLIPSGVLQCAEECGDVLSVLWVPTLHFDATPLLLVAYTSGTVEVYGRAANAAGVVSSPKMLRSPSSRRHFGRAASVAPWTYFDYSTGESRAEYEVVFHKNAQTGVGLSVESQGGELVVTDVTAKRSVTDQVAIGDEVVGVNQRNLIGKSPAHVQDVLDAIPLDDMFVVRFRAKRAAAGRPVNAAASFKLKSNGSNRNGDSSHSIATSSPTAASTDDEAERHSVDLRRQFLSALDDISTAEERHAQVVHAGAVSTYGGWKQIARVQAAPSFALVCVCPVYADDGDYVPNTVLLFGVSSVPGTLNAWKGIQAPSSKTYELTALGIQSSAIARKHDITSIAGERDYRQRAFSSKRQGDATPTGLNSLLFVGCALGLVQHWRCHLTGDTLVFTLMSTCSTATGVQTNESVSNSSADTPCDSSVLFRRGYVNPESRGPARNNQVSGTRHIEVDDPNRIAVLDSGAPDTLHIYEAESGLGILRLEESIPSGGRGSILGFCWCNAHVEFNVDVLAVHYLSGIVLYQYDMNAHRWVQIGDDMATPYSIFDCTRDSSALLIGGGFQKHVDADANAESTSSVSNEMPDVLGKWDEPGNLLQYSMDWKAAESPQKLPIWHPYVIITTLFGMHARVGVKDTQLAGDQPAYEFSKAFKDAVQMLKLLAKVVEDKLSAQVSVRSGVLSYSASRKATGSSGGGSLGLRDSVGRYSTAVHTKQISKAEHLFGASSGDDMFYQPPLSKRAESASSGRLDKSEADVISDAIDAVLFRKSASPYKETGALLFGSFSEEHFLEMKAILHYVNGIQSLAFEMDASAADLGAKRFFSAHTFAKSLKSVLTETKVASVGKETSAVRAEIGGETERRSAVQASLDEAPSSAILWALHSDSQRFLLDNCVPPQASWDDLRPLWLGIWVKNTKDLRAAVERLAKSTFARTKDAMSVCLFYIALGKKNVLNALAKMSKSEQSKKLAVFLDHDFAQERWCNAAVKNAYSLLSKKQYESAAAFFLVCEPPRLQEALRVLTARMADPSLALVVARLVEYRSNASFQQDFISSLSQHDVTSVDELTRGLLEHDIVPLFRATKDRWMESCALWWLEDFDQASTVLQPLSQAVDAAAAAVAENLYHPMQQKHGNTELHCKAVVHFYINLTSIPIYFQYLHSNANTALLSWARKRQQRQALAPEEEEVTGDRTVELSSLKSSRALASTADIEHAFSFSAYACKRNGLSDTALVEMLQARHLVNVHARVELAAAAESGDHDASAAAHAGELTSPRVRASLRDLRRLEVVARGPAAGGRPPWSASPRRMSDLHELDLTATYAGMLSGDDPLDKMHLFRSNTMNLSRLLPPGKPATRAPWLKAQIADIECRRWSSSAFVGKMIGIRVAREMISHFRAELDRCFRHFDPAVEHFRAEPHKEFLEELCAPLCEQFEVDRNYVVEAALGVMQPHAYLHIVEICFLLSELGRAATLCKWVQYVALSMLHSCSTFASCTITDDIYRDWEGLTVQLCYLLNLDAQGQLQLPNSIVAQVAVAVRTGCIFLSWCGRQSGIVHEAILAPFFASSKERDDFDDDEYFAELSMYSFEQNVVMLRKLQQDRDTAGARARSSFIGTFGYTFLETVASFLGSDNSKQPRGAPLSGAASVPAAAASSTSTSEKIASHWRKLRKMYTLILMVSILRTHYARCQVFLREFDGASEVRKDLEERDISSALFTPRKLWKSLEEAPLDGLKRWYSLMESHLRCEFDYSVKDVVCLCGLYGLDGSALKLAELSAPTEHHNKPVRHGAAPLSSSEERSNAILGVENRNGDSDRHHRHHFFHHHHCDQHQHHHCDQHQHHHHFHLPHLHLRQHLRFLHHVAERCDVHLFLRDLGISDAVHQALAAESDDYVLLLMQHPRVGVEMALRRFRVDPRVHVRCFLVQDAFAWLQESAVFATPAACHQFLKRCCKARKLRLLLQQVGQLHHPLFDHHQHQHHDDDGDMELREASSADNKPNDDNGAEAPSPAPLEAGGASSAPEKLFNEALMFVNPWEVEAVESVLRYMHKMKAPRHIELGWDRLSPICTETCDSIIASVFVDAEMVAMWKATSGEGWLVSSITQYQLDGGYSSRSGGGGDGSGGGHSSECATHCSSLSFESTASSRSPSRNGDQSQSRCSGGGGGGGAEEEARVPFLAEIHARSQRNAMFREVGLPHRFVGELKVALLEGRDLIPCGWIMHTSNPYVFFELAPGSSPSATADSWRIDTHRSRVGEGGVNPRWGTLEDEFTFRFAVPTHRVHVRSRSGAQAVGPAENAWQASATDESRRAAHGLESLFQALYTGPPVLLHCAVFHKSQLVPHHFMGRGKVGVPLNELTSGNPLELWIPLDEVPRGALHVRLSLSFRLMCSGVGSAQEIDDIV